MTKEKKREAKFSTSKHHQHDFEKAFVYFQQAIFAFKKKRNFNFFIPTEVVFRGPAREALKVIIENMEKFRCETLAMGLTKFYRLAAEFILIPNERQYYPLKQIFSLNPENYVAEEFQMRIKNTMIWIADVVYKHVNSNEVLDFIKEVQKKGSHLNFKNTELKSKNWYCVVAMLEYIKKKGWSKELLLQKFNKFYYYRTKNVLPEAVLMDLVHGEMDQLDVQQKTKGSKKYDFMKTESFNKEWAEQLRGLNK